MAAAGLKDLLTAFHPNGGSLAITGGDGRIKIWGVQNGEMQCELVDTGATSISGAGTDRVGNGHLSADYACMTWGPLLSVSSAKKAKKKGSREKTAALLVVGTGSGDVLGWDTTLGELKWRSNNCHAGGVRTVAVSRGGQRVYSGGSDGIVCELDCTTGQVLSKFRAAKTAVSCVAVSPDGGSLVAGSSELKLFDLSSQKRIRKYTGHPASVKAMLFTEDGRYFLSCAVGERQIAVWQCEGSKAEAGIVCSLSVEQPAVALHCCMISEGKESVRVAAVSESGVAYVWSSASMAELGTVKPTRITIGKGSKDNRACILAVRLVEGEEAVLVARGTSAKPQFEQVALQGHEGSTVDLGPSENGALLKAPVPVSNAAQAQQEVTVLGPDNAADAVIPHSQVEIAVSTKKSKKKRHADAEEDVVQLTGKTEAEDLTTHVDGPGEATVMADDEQTMEERLIALDLIANTHDDEIATLDKVVVPPRADSMQVLLSQALQAEDNVLLEQCLSVTDDRIISNTVRRLQPLEATKFLTLSVSKMEARPQRALGLVPWVRAVLLHHAAFIMSNPGMRPVLTSLYQIIDSRLSMFRPLLSLSGRLDLIMAKISANQPQEKDAEEAGAAIVYVEEDSEPEAEDAMVDNYSESDDRVDDSMDEDEDEDKAEDEDEDGDGDEEEVYGNGTE